MEYGFLSRAGKFLQEQKKHRRWMMIFLCLAGGVTLGTLAFLKLYGQAMTHQVKMLDCQYEVHEHTDDCYEEDENGVKTLVCGYADYVLHVHNDDCYDRRGVLVCPLKEHEPHEHTEECYGEERILVCGEEKSEAEPEAETEAPAAVETAPEAEPSAPEPAATETVLTCGKEEHTHTDSCYPEACPLSEHTHGDGCYTETLTCSEEEHSHDDSCYDEEGTLTCSKEEHSHDGGCYTQELTCTEEEHTHSEACSPSGPVCGMEEHTHTDDCYTEQTVEAEKPAAEPAETPVETPAETPAAEKAPVKEGHTHTDDCYETVEGLICGEQEPHIHDDSCYSEDCFDEDGNLIEGSHPSCGLLQLEEHVHTEECFKTVELTPEEVAALNNGATLHIHDDTCYDEDGNLICGHEVTHIHGLDCYDEDGNLICGFAEEETDHEHDANCYDEEGNLTCGYEHAKDHEHDANCYDEEGIRICGFSGVKDHEHGADCYDENGELVCGYEGVKDHEHRAECYDILGNLICGYEGAADHVHTEDCYDEEGNLICGYDVRTSYEQSKVYECGEYIVVARYNSDAALPEDVEFLAEQITPETDEEHYANREAEYQEMMGDETASMKALLKIGFYLTDEDGEKTEVEPKAPVEIAVQFLGEDGLAEGKMIKVIHFAEEGTEKLDGSAAKDNSTTFTMESFSEVAIIEMDQTEKNEAAEPQPLLLDETYEYEAEPFLITFHVTGEAWRMSGHQVMIVPEGTETPGEDTDSTEGEGTAGEAGPTEDGETAGEANPAEDGETAGETDSVEGGAESEPEADGTPEDSAESGDETDTADDTTSEGEGDVSDEPTAGDTEAGAPSGEPVLQFSVVPKNDDPEISEALSEYLGESDDAVSRRVLHTLTYTLNYKGEPLDLSECTVTAEITLGKASEKGAEDAALGEGDEQAPEENLSDGADAENNAADSEETDGEETLTTEGEGAEDAPEGGETAGAAPSADDESEDGTESSEDAEAAVAAYAASTDLDVPEGTNVDLSVMVLEVSEKKEVSKVGTMRLSADSQIPQTKVTLHNDTVAVADTSLANPTFTVQYYAYAQIMEDREGYGSTSINIIDTVKEGQASVLDGAQLPDNNGKPRTRKMYLESAGVGPYTAGWPVFNPVYKDKDSVDSLTKIYTADLYEYREVSGGLKHINKFAKDGLNYDLFEVWVMDDKTKADSNSTDKKDWKVYSGNEIAKLVFRNNDVTAPDEISIHITENTVIRLVGKSNKEENKNYPARFFDYDFTNGTLDQGDARERKGINSTANYANTGYTANYGFGNSNSGSTGLENDTLPGGAQYINYINQAKKLKTSDGKGKSPNTIIEKCFFGLVESELSSAGYPRIKADAPDLFNPENKNVKGRTEIPGYSLNFDRDGDTYTLTSVSGSGQYAQNLNQFQRSSEKAWGTEPGDPVFTNQFWPMDNASTWGTNGHDPKFGTKEIYDDYHLIASDDGQLHNSFFGMTFEVEFELTDDYVGPLNYYFFGDDDMWVFLEYPDKTTKLICDIGGVHQAAGEYVDLWNYIQKPEDNDTVTNTGTGNGGVNPKYKLKFFYTERGASGSTCWMQFTLPSVNAVPVKDYTGNVKSTLTLGKTVEGELEDGHTHGPGCYNARGELTCTKQECRRFDFTIKFSGKAANISTNDYPYEIRNADKSLVETGDIRSGGTFKLGHGQTIEVFNLPDKTAYIIEEKNHSGYEPGLGDKNTSGTITENQTVEGNIDWTDDDVVDYINKEIPYNLPETGGPGAIWYMLASAFLFTLGAGLIYSKKFSERRA